LTVDGILNINKPGGRTSFSIVAMVKRLTGERRVGHAGTLDPAATGVLPVCLGQGTRVIEFLVGAPRLIGLRLNWVWLQTPMMPVVTLPTEETLPGLAENNWRQR